MLLTVINLADTVINKALLRAHFQLLFDNKADNLNRCDLILIAIWQVICFDDVTATSCLEQSWEDIQSTLV